MAFLPTVSVRALRALLEYLESRGADPEHIWPLDRRRSTSLEDDDAQISALSLRGFWKRAAESLNDPCVGLHAAEAADASTFGVYSFLAITSPNWGESIERVCRYQRLVESGGQYRLLRRGAIATYEVVAPYVPPSDQRHLLEFSVTVAFLYSQRHVATQWNPTGVSFGHAAPQDTSEHQRIFGVRPRFGANSSGFSFDSALLNTPMRRGDRALSATLETHAKDLIAKIPENQGMEELVRVHLAHALPGGDPSLKAIAKVLAMTPRTLQRHLKARGTSHQSLLVEFRKNTAQDLLKSADLGLSEISFLLGFSEVAAFHRAFRRWTGETPGVFRRRHQR